MARKETTDQAHELCHQLVQTSVNTASVPERISYFDCPYWRNTKHIGQELLTNDFITYSPFR